MAFSVMASHGNACVQVCVCMQSCMCVYVHICECRDQVVRGEGRGCYKTILQMAHCPMFGPCPKKNEESMAFLYIYL